MGSWRSFYGNWLFYKYFYDKLSLRLTKKKGILILTCLIWGDIKYIIKFKYFYLNFLLDILQVMGAHLKKTRGDKMEKSCYRRWRIIGTIFF